MEKIEHDRVVLRHQAESGRTLYLGFALESSIHKPATEWNLAFLGVDLDFMGEVIDASGRQSQVSPQAYQHAWQKALHGAIDLTDLIRQHALTLELEGLLDAIQSRVQAGDGWLTRMLNALLKNPKTRIMKGAGAGGEKLAMVIQYGWHKQQLEDLITLLTAMDRGVAKACDSNFVMGYYRLRHLMQRQAA